jgi:uncharacterized membrane protein YeaQ/YmgE (transglycosylase-associated protein family)
MVRGDISLKIIRALIVLGLIGAPLSVWLLWTLGDELVRSMVQQDWAWTATWGAVTVIMCCGVGRVIQEGWWLWKESRQQT